MRIIVDKNRCNGHARCLAVAPNVYVLNIDGYNEMPETRVPPGKEGEAKLGARACPERAIKIVED
jgi:ferredoxin